MANTDKDKEIYYISWTVCISVFLDMCRRFRPIALVVQL